MTPAIANACSDDLQSKAERNDVHACTVGFAAACKNISRTALCLVVDYVFVRGRLFQHSRLPTVDCI